MSSIGVIKNPSAPQADPRIIAALRGIAVALLSDNLHRSSGSVGLKPYHSPAPMVGTAVTIRTRGGDNLAVLRAYDFCRPGDVMVIDAGGDLANAVFGGIMSFAAMSMGLAGMVVDGAIRSDPVQPRGEPVFRVERGQRLVDLDEDLLRQVERLFALAAEPVEVVDQGPLMPPDEGLERRTVAVERV